MRLEGLLQALLRYPAQPVDKLGQVFNQPREIRFPLVVSFIHVELTDAQITGGSSVTSAGLTVSAQDTSNIGTGAGQVDIAVGKGFTARSLGAAVAINTVSNTVQAYIDGSTVHSSTPVYVTATSSETILAIAVGVAGAVSNFSFSAALFGSYDNNTIGDSTEALVEDGSNVNTANSTAVNVTATETAAKITAAAGVLAVSYNSSGAPAVAAGVSGATNAIGTSGTPDLVEAAIENSIVVAGGGVTVSATTSPIILAITVAGTGAVSNGGTGAIGISGAGAGSENSIYQNAQALINTGSSVTTQNAGSVMVSATNSGSIEADGGGLSIGGSIGSGPGGAVAVGAAWPSTTSPIAPTRSFPRRG